MEDIFTVIASYIGNLKTLARFSRCARITYRAYRRLPEYKDIQIFNDRKHACDRDHDCIIIVNVLTNLFPYLDKNTTIDETSIHKIMINNPDDPTIFEKLSTKISYFSIPVNTFYATIFTCACNIDHPKIAKWSVGKFTTLGCEFSEFHKQVYNLFTGKITFKKYTGMSIISCTPKFKKFIILENKESVIKDDAIYIYYIFLENTLSTKFKNYMFEYVMTHAMYKYMCGFAYTSCIEWLKKCYYWNRESFVEEFLRIQGTEELKYYYNSNVILWIIKMNRKYPKDFPISKDPKYLNDLPDYLAEMVKLAAFP